MKIAVVCAPGIGDALIMHIASYHLAMAGFDVTTVTPHRFGKWLEGYKFGEGADCEAIFLQHDNSTRAKEIHACNKQVYTFYGSHVLSKHGPLRIGYDYVCNQNQTMVDNILASLKLLFNIPATPDNGFRPPLGLLHRRHTKRVLIHHTSNEWKKNWPKRKFTNCAQWLKEEGYEPSFLPLFPTLEDLASHIYESGFFLGNDSGPGHLASLLQIPHLIIGPDERQMRFWRPGWKPSEIIVPPRWIPRKWRKYWKNFITTNRVINRLKIKVLNN